MNLDSETNDNKSKLDEFFEEGTKYYNYAKAYRHDRYMKEASEVNFYFKNRLI